MTLAEQAIKTYQQGYNCSQAVYATFAERLGEDRATALKIASGFGGGIGRTGNVCGAVSGAIMALGLKHGFTEGSPQAKADMYARAQEFMNAFTAQYGALACRELLGYDISIPEEFEQLKQQNLFATRCVEFIRSAVNILEKMGC